MEKDKSSDSQDSLQKRMLEALNRTAPNVILINFQKEVLTIDGSKVLFLSVNDNYTHVNSINKGLMIIKKPLIQVYPLFEKFLVSMGDGLALNFNRITKIEKESRKVIFDDESFTILKQSEGRLLCKVIRWFYNSKSKGKDSTSNPD
jgi:hypothetical protein